MNRRTVLASVAAAAAFAAVPAWAQTDIDVLEGAARAEGIAQANRALNGFQRLRGRFTQTAPGGARATGAIYLQRPGKLRFEYDPPNPLLIVSDGSVVALRDPQLRTTERTPLRSTPLALILGERIDLERQARVTRVSRAGPWLMVTMRDRGGQTDGEITIQFYGDETELRSWDVRDATGARTRITLSEVSFPASLDRSLFRLEDMLERNRPGGR